MFLITLHITLTSYTPLPYLDFILHLCIFIPYSHHHFITATMDYLRMDGKRGHVTCGNRLEIERQESFQKFASLQEELLLASAQACWDPTRFRMA